MNTDEWIICVRCPRCKSMERIYHMHWSASKCPSCQIVLDNPMEHIGVDDLGL